MAITRTVPAAEDAWFVLTGGSNWGNGKGGRFSVGRAFASSADWRQRFAIKLARGATFDGVPNADAITKFDIKLRTRSGCDGQGTAVAFFLERATAAMGESSGSGLCEVYLAGTVGVQRYPGPARVTADRAFFSGGALGNDVWITVNALALGKWWYANPSVTELVLVGVAANLAGTDYDPDQATAARRASFYSRHTTSAPFAELVFNDEQPPFTPADLTPPDGAKVGSTAGTSLTVSARYTHPEGKAGDAYHAQWFSSGATDETPGTPLKDQTVTVSIANNAIRSHTFTGLDARTPGKWRIRFQRVPGVWGPFSPLRTATTAYLPGVPANPSVTPATLSPDFFASLVSQDSGDFITAAEVIVYQDPVSGSAITKWASGKAAIGGTSTRYQLAYGGTALTFGTKYRWETRVWNRDDVPSEFTGNLFFTPRESVGPTIQIRVNAVNQPADQSVKVNTLTPVIRVTDPGGANIDQAQVRLYSPAGAVVHDFGLVSFTSAAFRDFTVPANVWNWGQEPMVDARIRVTGNANPGPFSEQHRIRINATPGAPGPFGITNAGTVRRPDGVWVVPTTTPTLVFPFRDVDRDLGYTEGPTRREIETRSTLTDTHIDGSPFIITTGITDEYTTGALSNETLRKARARYDDNAAVRSGWSEYATFKTSTLPIIDSVLPTGSVTVPRPTVTYAYGHVSGIAQAAHRLELYVSGNRIYDTGWLSMAGGNNVKAFAPVPPRVLPTGVTVTRVISVRNIDGLEQTNSSTFTTNFTQPPALTVTIQENADEMALDVSWNLSGLSNAEFYAYYVYARGQFRLLATITDKAQTSYRYEAAVHSTDENISEMLVRVTQDNGWKESEPAEASATLFVRGYFLRRGGVIEELRFIGDGDYSETLPTEQHEYSPLGATRKRIITGDTYGHEIRLRLRLPPGELDIIDRLRDDQRTGRVVLLKKRGRSAYCMVREVPSADHVVGWASCEITLTEVE